MPYDHKCSICGDRQAPYGYRMAGPLSTVSRAGYLWACADHRGDADLRWRSANASPAARGADTSAGGAGLQPKPKAGGRIHTAADDTQRGFNL